MAPVVSYFLCDSWYTSVKVMDSFIQKGFYTNGALKTNRIIYPFGIRQKSQRFCPSFTKNRYGRQPCDRWRLLDEIEAALDDSNVTRFAQYLHKLTKNTQFIVITHRRGTMNAADRLYGITMQEKGVSTLVSVNLIENQLDE